MIFQVVLKDNLRDINTETTQLCNTLCDFHLHYKPSKCKVNFKNNQVIIKYDRGSYLEYMNIMYELKEIQIYVPTLHSIEELNMIRNMFYT